MATCKDCFHWGVCEGGFYSQGAEGCGSWADASRIVELPCRIGDDIWWIDNETNSVECEKNGVTGFIIKKDEILIRDTTGGEDRIGTQYCYLSKAHAEAALAERRMRGG